MLHSLVQITARLLLRLCFRVRVQGEQIDFSQKKLLIVSNHESFIDGILLGAFLPGQPTYVVHTSVAKIWYFKILLSGIPYVVVDTNSPLAMKTVINMIENGTPVVIFPEGRITVTGALMKVYDGPAFVAAKSGAAVVPVNLIGPARTIVSKLGGKFPRQLFPRITLTIGKPVFVQMPEAKTSRLRRRKASGAMYRIMQNMQLTAQPLNTIHGGLLDAIALHGKNKLVVEDIRQVEESYGTFLKTVLALGRIAGKVTSEGENVGVLLPTTTTSAALVFGLTSTGRTAAMLNFTAGADGISSACKAAKIKVILTSKQFLEQGKLAETVKKIEGVTVYQLEELRPRFTLGDKLWLMLYALRFPRSAMRTGSPEEAAVILFTSGSEGKPKGVVLSHRALLANVNQIQTIIRFTFQDKMLNAMPIFHAFGLTAGTLLPLLGGCRVFLYPSPLHYRIVPELVYDRDVTIFFGTNTFLQNYAKFAHPFDLHRLRLCIAGAEKVSDDTRKTYYEKFGVRILEGYGATECAPVVSVNTPMASKDGTVGTLLPGMEYRFQPVPGIEGAGELHVKGPNVMSGYLKVDNPGVLQPPSSVEGDGWYNTGDIVAMDEDGFLTIKARLKRFAKVAGEMVSLEVVETIAAKATPKGSAATTQPDPGRGEMIVLFTEDPNLKRDQLQAAARELGAPEIAIAKKIIFIDKLPLLGTGKKDYVKLKSIAEEKQAVAKT